MQAATHTWKGAVSSDWSEPLNWEGGTPVENGDVVLTPNGDFLPTNQDIPDLKIKTLSLGTGYPDGKLTISGETLWISTKVSDSGTKDSTTVFTFENDIVGNGVQLDFSLAGNTLREYSSKVVLLGDLKDNGVNVPLKIYCGGYGTVLLSGRKSFHGHFFSNIGYISFDGDAALGVNQLPAAGGYTLHSNCGNYEVVRAPGREYQLTVLDPLRTFGYASSGSTGGFYLSEGVDFAFSGDFGSGVLKVYQTTGAVRSPSFLFIRGVSSGLTQVEANTGIVIVQDCDGAVGTSDALLRSQYGTFDFNGYDATRPLYNWTQGMTVSGEVYGPNFVNNNTARETVIPTRVGIGFQNAHCMFGGTGDIRFMGDVVQDAGKSYKFFHADGGKLTFAGENCQWAETSFTSGSIVFDNTVYNTTKLTAAAQKAFVLSGGARLTLKGNDAAATMETLPKVTFSDGANLAGSATFEVEAGNADTTLQINSISVTGSTPLNFVCVEKGAGKARIVLPNNTNDPDFIGLWTGVVWNNGETYAKLDANGVVGPMPDEDYVTTYADSKSWDVPSGTVSFNGGRVRCMRFNATAGTTLEIAEGKQLKTVNKLAQPSGFLMTPSSGDVTIRGGTVKVDNYHHPLVIEQFNTTRKLRIESKIVKTINAPLHLFGPGETELVNDESDFDGRVEVSGGGKVSFTSIADAGEASSLGDASYDANIYLCDETTLNYIGTATEGHSSGRPVVLRGDATIAANGVGPLRLTGDMKRQWLGNYRLTLDGAGAGVLDGALKIGAFGSVVKTGSGMWTVNGTGHGFFYPTKVEAGTLVVNGELPSDVNVSAGATLASETGCTLKRNVSLAGTLLCDPAAESPVKVLGAVTLGGELKLAGKAREAVDLLVADGGITGEFASVPANVKVVYSANAVRVEPISGMMILVR